VARDTGRQLSQEVGRKGAADFSEELTATRGRVLPEKLTVAQLLKTFPTLPCEPAYSPYSEPIPSQAVPIPSLVHTTV
jgi:hypothetical protein